MTAPTSREELLALADRLAAPHMNKSRYEERMLNGDERDLIVAALRFVAQGAANPPSDFYLVPREIIDQFPEININNYDHDDACALNAWGCDVVTNANPAPSFPSTERGTPEPQPVAWRYRNEYDEVVSEWIDGPPPEYVRDANTCERIAVSAMKIDVAYSIPRPVLALTEKIEVDQS